MIDDKHFEDYRHDESTDVIDILRRSVANKYRLFSSPLRSQREHDFVENILNPKGRAPLVYNYQLNRLSLPQRAWVEKIIKRFIG